MICKCGRPRYTAGDLARWQNEIDKLAPDEVHPYNPEWARAICWTVHDQACIMKPITAPLW